MRQRYAFNYRNGAILIVAIHPTAPDTDICVKYITHKGHDFRFSIAACSTLRVFTSNRQNILLSSHL